MRPIPGPAGARPGLAELAQLAALLGARPAGLIGSGYRAFMAQRGQSGAPVVAPMAAASASAAPLWSAGGFGASPVAMSVDPAAPRLQVADAGGSCPTCHTATPPPPAPLALPKPEPLPPLPPPGFGAALLPFPIGAVVQAGRLGDMLSGPQVSHFVPPRDPPVPPGSGSGDHSDGSKVPKQCLVQMQLDEERCNELPYPRSRASANRRRRCWESLEARYAHCTTPATLGEVGYPPLRTR
jgi:hypothetical protein